MSKYNLLYESDYGTKIRARRLSVNEYELEDGRKVSTAWLRRHLNFKTMTYASGADLPYKYVVNANGFKVRVKVDK